MREKLAISLYKRSLVSRYCSEELMIRALGKGIFIALKNCIAGAFIHSSDDIRRVKAED
jgi:hypothetical protein